MKTRSRGAPGPTNELAERDSGGVLAKPTLRTVRWCQSCFTLYVGNIKATVSEITTVHFFARWQLTPNPPPSNQEATTLRFLQHANPGVDGTSQACGYGLRLRRGERVAGASCITYLSVQSHRPRLLPLVPGSPGEKPVPVVGRILVFRDITLRKFSFPPLAGERIGEVLQVIVNILFTS